MSDINLAPAISPDSLETCWLCQSGSLRTTVKNGNIRVERYRNDGGHEETVANLVVADSCASEVQALVADLDSVHSVVTTNPPEEALWFAKRCGFCDNLIDGEQWRTSAGVIIEDSGKTVVKKEVLLCDSCTDVFCDFLRNVGRSGR